MRVAAVVSVVLSSCAASPVPSPVSGADAGAPPDAGGPAVGLAVACDDACRGFTLAASFAGRTRAFDRVQFGLTAPAKSRGGGWELYLEAHRGGDAACPTASSASPAMTLVLSGLELPTDATPRTEADGLAATLFDFSGDLGLAPLVRATRVRVVPRALQAGLAGADAGVAGERVFAFDLEATFAGGTVAGAAFALPCATFDDL